MARSSEIRLREQTNGSGQLHADNSRRAVGGDREREREKARGELCNGQSAELVSVGGGVWSPAKRSEHNCINTLYTDEYTVVSTREKKWQNGSRKKAIHRLGRGSIMEEAEHY